MIPNPARSRHQIGGRAVDLRLTEAQVSRLETLARDLVSGGWAVTEQQALRAICAALLAETTPMSIRGPGLPDSVPMETYPKETAMNVWQARVAMDEKLGRTRVVQQNIEAFRAELAELLDRHGVGIWWCCCAALIPLERGIETARENVDRLDADRLDGTHEKQLVRDEADRAERRQQQLAARIPQEIMALGNGKQIATYDGVRWENYPYQPPKGESI